MPLQFLEEQLPTSISEGSSGGPAFSTSIFEAASGFEQRNVNWAIARCRYDISYGIRDKIDMDTVLDFFYIVKGRATGFRFKDWTDYSLVDEVIGVGDTVETAFQIVKKYIVGAEVYNRIIYKPVAPADATAKESAITFFVYVDGVLKEETTDYTIDYSTGIVSFVGAPSAGLDITVTGSFDVPVRFDIDQLPITAEAFEVESLSSIPLVELRTNA